MEKEITQIQIAWFLKNDYTGSFEELSLKIKNILGESKLTQHLPIPATAPSEIPRLVLVYDNFNVNFSKNRIDIFSKDFNLIKNEIEKITDIILNNLRLSIDRLGFVKNFFADGDINYLKTLLNNEKIIDLNLKEINVRLNTPLMIESFECNNIQAISNGRMKKAEIEKDGLVISRDVNTVKNKYNFNKAQVLRLIEQFNKNSEDLIV